MYRDRYEVLDVVAVGGQGRVLRARDVQHDRVVALKVRPVGVLARRQQLVTSAAVTAESAHEFEAVDCCTDRDRFLYADAMDVAISELRANLKSFIERARAGERIIVTDRGLPVARLGPAEEESVLDRLEREGVLTRATRPKSRTSKGRRVKATGPVADLVGEMRADRDARVLG